MADIQVLKAPQVTTTFSGAPKGGKRVATIKKGPKPSVVKKADSSARGPTYTNSKASSTSHAGAKAGQFAPQKK